VPVFRLGHSRRNAVGLRSQSLLTLEPKGHGSIVNVSSTYGQVGGSGASVYAASKHAVEGLTMAAALEAAESGVRVNIVACSASRSSP
jgi:NAD(P)-dependent dehydrogenase (short-subunit alcohol dehydrogenase family)